MQIYHVKIGQFSIHFYKTARHKPSRSAHLSIIDRERRNGFGNALWRRRHFGDWQFFRLYHVTIDLFTTYSTKRWRDIEDSLTHVDETSSRYKVIPKTR